MNVIDNIQEDKYKNTVPYALTFDKIDHDSLTGREVRELKEARIHQSRQQRASYQAEEARLVALFRSDLEAEQGMSGHPKADKLFELAWDLGHSSGLQEVANYYEDLVELVK